jgi:biopolymer transport protein ExbB
MASAIIGENSAFQSKIAYLSVIGVIAPMIGLTGTVVGMIQAFAAMGQAGAADPSKLSGAIGHVLHATAAGLAVAIPAFIFYYLIRNRTGHSIHALSDAANDLFRKFPYDHVAQIEFEGGESYAATPNWVNGGGAPVASGHE